VQFNGACHPGTGGDLRILTQRRKARKGTTGVEGKEEKVKAKRLEEAPGNKTKNKAQKANDKVVKNPGKVQKSASTTSTTRKRKETEQIKPAVAFVKQLLQSSVASQPPKKARKSTKYLTVGSDCTGLSSESLAFSLNNIKVNTLFCSDTDESKIRLLSAIHTLTGDTGYTLYKDIHSRDPEDVPQVQFYIAGAPCPAWSAAGPSHGLDDPKNRGVTLFHCLNYIRARHPCCVLLENVAGLTFRRNQHILTAITKILQNLRYRTWHRILNTRDHGIPHNRPRVYIVGIQVESYKHKFHWPKEIGCRPLQEFLNTTVTGKEEELTERVSTLTAQRCCWHTTVLKLCKLLAPRP